MTKVQQVFNLGRELNRERLRSRALEEAIETPQNIHRWRKLEETDPSTLELIDQIHMLQKCVIIKKIFIFTVFFCTKNVFFSGNR